MFQAKSLNEEMSKRVSRKNNNNVRLNNKIERNQLKTESMFDCSVEKCPVYVNQEKSQAGVGQRHKPNENAQQQLIFNEELQNLDNSENLLRTKMTAVISFIKSLNYDSGLNLVEFKRKINQHIHFLKDLNNDDHFSMDQSSFLNNFDACVNDNNEVKKLNECFITIFDRYSADVSDRIVKLKEKMKLINHVSINKLMNEEMKKMSPADESSLENYMEANPEFVLDGFKESESCQRFRDTTEL